MLDFVTSMSTMIGAEGAAAEGGSAGLMSYLPLVLIIALFYFMMIRPQRKQAKEVEKMRSELEVGDEIITRGGIIGRVVSIREDTLVIETGSDRSKIRIVRGAIEANRTAQEDAQKRAAAAREEQAKAKEEKKRKKDKDELEG